MPVKYGKNSEVVDAWASGESHPYSNHSGSLSHDHRTLYSYATAIGKRLNTVDGKEVLVVNMNDYSVTTSHHQYKAVGRSNAVPICTSALYKAGVNFDRLHEEVEVVDYDHRSLLFTKKGEIGEHYLSDFGWVWSATQIRLLPEPCETVGQAVNSLKPKGLLETELVKMPQLRNAIEENRNMKKGWERGYWHWEGSEWYFVELPVSGKEAKKAYKEMEHGECELPRKDGDGLRYWPTRICHAIDMLCFKGKAGSGGVPEWARQVNPKSIVVSGQVRCESKVFEMARLSTSDRPGLFLAIPDRAVKIWAGKR